MFGEQEGRREGPSSELRHLGHAGWKSSAANAASTIGRVVPGTFFGTDG
jgi:hypothetical protein